MRMTLADMAVVVRSANWMVCDIIFCFGCSVLLEVFAARMFDILCEQ